MKKSCRNIFKFTIKYGFDTQITCEYVKKYFFE